MSESAISATRFCKLTQDFLQGPEWDVEQFHVAHKDGFVNWQDRFDRLYFDEQA